MSTRTRTARDTYRAEAAEERRAEQIEARCDMRRAIPELIANMSVFVEGLA